MSFNRVCLVAICVLSLHETSRAGVDAGGVISNAPTSSTVAASGVGETWMQVWEQVTTKVKTWWGEKFGEKSSTADQAQKGERTPANAAGSVGKAPSSADAPALPPAPAQLLQALPDYKTSDKGTSQVEIESARAKIKSQSAVVISQPARAGSSELPRNAAGVPVFKLSDGKVKVRSLPRLDIGSEARVSKNDFTLPNLRIPKLDLKKANALPSPSLMKGKEIQSVVQKTPKPIAPVREVDIRPKDFAKPVTAESVGAIGYQIKIDLAVVEKPYEALSENQLRMLTALILYKRGNKCHVVISLFDKLSKSAEVADEAHYYVGLCADQLGLHQVAWERLSRTISLEQSDYSSAALSTLANDLHIEYEVRFAKLLRSIKKLDQLIQPEAKDDIYYRSAKGNYRLGEFGVARDAAEVVSEKSSLYASAQYLSAISSFGLGQKKIAVSKLLDLQALLNKKAQQDKNLKTLVALNLARVYFAQGAFKEAFENYMKVEKDHALWVQALIEQGWAQLAMEDFAGAIGNMYSLHSPYFRAVYQPVSFVVRSIGYLNICQYGDAYRTLSWLENDYRPWLTRVSHFNQQNKQGGAYYDTVKQYLMGKSQAEVGGLPYQTIREVARQKEFLNIQTAMNDLSDEQDRLNGLSDRIRQERGQVRARIDQAQKRSEQLRVQIQKAMKDPALRQQVPTLEHSLGYERELMVSLRHLMTVLEDSRVFFGPFLQASSNRIETFRGELRSSAGQVLMRHMKRVEKEIARVLDNNEFLRYEVFSGSGENIRYQVTGGETAGPNRVPASVRPSKSLQWSFDGEYWEDEIGSYRSSLQNNCPQSSKMGEYFKSKNSKDQAALGKGESK